MAAMFDLYHKRDGRYNKSPEMWASGLCRYLNDAYPSLAADILKLLVEVSNHSNHVCNPLLTGNKILHKCMLEGLLLSGYGILAENQENSKALVFSSKALTRFSSL